LKKEIIGYFFKQIVGVIYYIRIILLITCQKKIVIIAYNSIKS